MESKPCEFGNLYGLLIPQSQIAVPAPPARSSTSSVSELIKGPRRRRKFAKKLYNFLLIAQEDIAKGNRFQEITALGNIHWSRQRAGGQPRPSSETSQEEELIFQFDLYHWERADNSNSSKTMSGPATAQRSNGGVSPSSSPRLPSPPPSVEVQFGPKSPSVSGAVSEFSLDKTSDDAASRRIRPGTKAADMSKGPPFVHLHQLESPFQLQEYLQSFYATLTRDETTQNSKPIDKETALRLATPPTAQDTGEVVDRNLWLYELCRFLCNKTTRIIVGFFNDHPSCSSQTCPEMRASEWQYLCAVHEPPKSCCAIDYCNHTLDWASNILTSPKHFPSRLSLGGEGGSVYQSMRQLTNIFRRVYRIYAHAWFQHQQVFWNIESELGLYILFKTVCDQYQLIPEDNYTIPPQAEGEREEKDVAHATRTSPEKSANVSILRRGTEQVEQGEDQEQEANNTATTGATTRRHKHTPSTGIPVSVIAEGQEDEDGEETTIIDLGGPGPAQEASHTLHLPEPRVERAKSPGLIKMPQAFDPEWVPEDPTPVAHHEFNPFGAPGPTEVTADEPDDSVPNVSVHEPESETVIEPASDQDSAAPTPQVAAVGTNSNSLDAVLGHMQDLDISSALDSDTETQIAVEDSKHGDTVKEDDEAMGVIDISEITKCVNEPILAKDEKAQELTPVTTDKNHEASTT